MTKPNHVFAEEGPLMPRKVKESNGLAGSSPFFCFLTKPAINPLNNMFGG